MPKDSEIYLSYIEEIFGPAELIKKHECPHGGPPVHVFVYRDVPEKGMITGITYGLSTYAHPEWVNSRPEMIISVESDDEMWAWNAAYFCAEFRGEKRFSYGDVFTTEDPLTDDTKMDGLLIFPQSILDPEMQSVQLNDYKVHLSQFYPIHRSELDVYHRIGLERFWKHEGFGMYDPKRRPVQG